MIISCEFKKKGHFYCNNHLGKVSANVNAKKKVDDSSTLENNDDESLKVDFFQMMTPSLKL